MVAPADLRNRVDSLLTRVENRAYELSPADALAIRELRDRYLGLLQQNTNAKSALQNAIENQRQMRELSDRMVTVLDHAAQRTRNQAIGGSAGFGISAGLSIFFGLSTPVALPVVVVCTTIGIWIGSKVPPVDQKLI